MNRDTTYLVLLALSTVIFTVFFCPYLDAHNLDWLCVAFYAIVVVTFLFSQTAMLIRKRRER